MKIAHRKYLLTLTLPLLLLAPMYPSVSVWIFKMREPSFQVPIAVSGPLQIRSDPYGSGLFGARRSGGRKHRGVDLVAPVGSRAVASKSGTAMIGRKKNGMGRYVEVRHPDGWMSRYGHLKSITIRDRQRVRRGDAVGTVGKSGNAKRRIIQPHLHFEVWNEKEEPLDPLAFLETTNDP